MTKHMPSYFALFFALYLMNSRREFSQYHRLEEHVKCRFRMSQLVSNSQSGADVCPQTNAPAPSSKRPHSCAPHFLRPVGQFNIHGIMEGEKCGFGNFVTKVLSLW